MKIGKRNGKWHQVPAKNGCYLLRTRSPDQLLPDCRRMGRETGGACLLHVVALWKGEGKNRSPLQPSAVCSLSCEPSAPTCHGAFTILKSRGPGPPKGAWAHGPTKPVTWEGSPILLQPLHKREIGAEILAY